MHHKVLIIDGRTVVTGSYNFTANAERRNDENVLVIHNPQIAAQFLEEFHRLYDQARQ
jgi:phosphatidylserine/phosphatidylglycerophosphate/cardiolipin synthase-like enzyme